MVKVEQYSIWLVNLGPIIGAEIKKTRPTVIISPNEINVESPQILDTLNIQN
jgi:mRNA interferase MazF